jgi:glutamine amidotransferase
MIAIVDYKAGNITSVQRALNALGFPSVITPDPDAVRRAERVIVPGVGQAASAMAALRERGMDQALREAFARGIPLLGICLGAQITLAHSEEGDTECLGLLPGKCRLFEIADPALKIPHIGWDQIRLLRPHPVLEGLGADDEFYFDHSYYPQPADPARILAECDYGLVFPAVIGAANFVAAQFHPEKSGPPGLRIMANFAGWDGDPRGAAC